MGASGGRRRAETASKSPSPLVALGSVFGGAILTALAWFVLVRAAIDFGGDAKNGEGIGWLFMVLATLGAIACLVLTLVLITRGLGALGVVGPKASGRRSSK